MLKGPKENFECTYSFTAVVTNWYVCNCIICHPITGAVQLKKKKTRKFY